MLASREWKSIANVSKVFWRLGLVCYGRQAKAGYYDKRTACLLILDWLESPTLNQQRLSTAL